MGQKKFPVLENGEVERILMARGFVYSPGNKGDHNFYTHIVGGKKRIVQIDTGCPEYDHKLIKMVLKESGLTREEFYRSTKIAAKKINKKHAQKTELLNWASKS